MCTRLQIAFFLLSMLILASLPNLQVNALSIPFLRSQGSSRLDGLLKFPLRKGKKKKAGGGRKKRPAYESKAIRC